MMDVSSLSCLIVLLSVGTARNLGTPGDRSIGEGACFNYPCLNEGNCIELEHKPVCNCPANYTGLHCEVPNSCHFNTSCDDDGGSPAKSRCLPSLLDDQGYQCVCQPGWTGEGCRDDVDECAAVPSPCQNNGSCINMPGSYGCLCPMSYHGIHCEHRFLHCSPSPCRNNATCREEAHSYRCECAPGFEGINCTEEIDECGTVPCLNGGQCEDLLAAYQCHCLPGFEGDHCQHEVLLCQASTCQNNGVCREDAVTGKNYTCICPDGFTGRHCQVRTSHCLRVTCANGGQCMEGEASRWDISGAGAGGGGGGGGGSADGVAGWRCLCPPGFAGQFCEEGQAETSSSGRPVDQSDAVIVSSSPANHKAVGPKCSVASCGGQVPEGGSPQPTCNCPPAGPFQPCCSTAVNRSASSPLSAQKEHTATDLCANKPCQNRGACTTITTVQEIEGTMGQLETGLMENVSTVSCQCQPGFTGTFCEINVFECFDKPCGANGVCHDRIDHYQCECFTGYSGEHCSVSEGQDNRQTARQSLTGSQRPVAILGEVCGDYYCANGATCRVTSSGFACDCRSAVGVFTGENCDLDVDECDVGPTDYAHGQSFLCDNGGQCVNTHGGYFCRCPLGFHGDRCQHPRDACNDSLSSSVTVCLNGGVCLSRGNGTHCLCPAGFTGPFCEQEVNECAASPCLHDAVCLDLINSYVCLCQPGFSGRRCEVENNSSLCGDESGCLLEQVQANLNCANGGVFVPATEGNREAYCDCPRGFVGALCEGQVNLCRTALLPSVETIHPERLSLVSELLHRHLYRSLAYDVGHRFLRRFLGAVAWSPLADTTYSLLGDCNPVGTAHCSPNYGGFTCHCKLNYVGQFCEQPRDDCQAADLRHNGTYCLNGGWCKQAADLSQSVEFATCQCPPSFWGPRCEEEVPSHCRIWEDDCGAHGQCRPPKDDQPLRPYTCQCQHGWAGVHCEVSSLYLVKGAPEPCHPLQCRHGARCWSDGVAAACQCLPGYCGEECELSGPRCAPTVTTKNLSLGSDSATSSTVDLNQCLPEECSWKRGNGRCDPECNLLACAFDAGDCLYAVSESLKPLSAVRTSPRDFHRSSSNSPDEEEEAFESQPASLAIPWTNCSTSLQRASACQIGFADGYCDPGCASEACLFDGWDCEEEGRIHPPEGRRCQDTVCGQSPAAAAANTSSPTGEPWSVATSKEDEPTRPPSLSGYLVLLIDTEPGELLLSLSQGPSDPSSAVPQLLPSSTLRHLLANLSQLLHLEVRLSHHPVTGEPMAYQVDLPVPITITGMKSSPLSGDRRLRSPRHIREPPWRTVPAVGSQVYLELDATACRMAGGTCFGHVDTAAQFLAATMGRRRARGVDDLPASRTEPPTSVRSASSSSLQHILSIQSVGIAGGRQVTRRRMLGQSVWLWTLQWPLVLLVAVGCIFILGLCFGVLYLTGQHQHQQQQSQYQPAQKRIGACQPRRSLSVYLQLIYKRKNAMKVKKAKVWYPENGLLGRSKTVEASKLGIHSVRTDFLPHAGITTDVHQTAAGSNGKLCHLAAGGGGFGFSTFGVHTDKWTDARGGGRRNNAMLDWYPQEPAGLTSTYSSAHSDLAKPVGLGFGYDGSGATVVQSTAVAAKMSRTTGSCSWNLTTFGDFNDQTNQRLAPGQNYPTAEDTKKRKALSYKVDSLTRCSASIPHLEAGHFSGGQKYDRGTSEGSSTSTTSTRVATGGLEHEVGGVGEEESGFYEIFQRLVRTNGLLEAEDDGTVTSQPNHRLFRCILQSAATPGVHDRSVYDPAVHNGVGDLFSGAGGGGALSLASEAQSTSNQLKLLLDSQLPETGETLLHVAARTNQSAALSDLLDFGADPTSVDNCGRTPLLSAICGGAVEAAATLLEHPVAGNNPMCFVPSLLTDSTTPLIQAVKLGDTDAFRMVLHSMNIVLCKLTRITQQHSQSVPTQSKSVAVNAPRDCCNTSQLFNRHFAPPDDHCTQLVDVGVHEAAPNHFAAGDMGPTIAAAAVAGIFPEPTSASPTSVSQLVIEDSLLSMLDLNIADSSGRTALHWAAATNQPDMVSCLLEAGAAYDVQTVCDETPLVLAAKEGAYSVCRLLLLAGANQELPDYLDRTPRLLAELGNYKDCVRLLTTFASLQRQQQQQQHQQHQQTPVSMRLGQSGFLGFMGGSRPVPQMASLHTSAPTADIYDVYQRTEASLFLSDHPSTSSVHRLANRKPEPVEPKPAQSRDEPGGFQPTLTAGMTNGYAAVEELPGSRLQTNVSPHHLPSICCYQPRGFLHLTEPMNTLPGDFSHSDFRSTQHPNFCCYPATEVTLQAGGNQEPVATGYVQDLVKQYPTHGMSAVVTTTTAAVVVAASAGDSQVVNSDSDSPNHWSSSPSEFSPNRQLQLPGQLAEGTQQHRRQVILSTGHSRSVGQCCTVGILKPECL